MRIDSETTHFHSSPVHEPTSKTVECSENGLEPKILKENDNIRRELDYETASPFDVERRSEDIDIDERSHAIAPQDIITDDSDLDENETDSFTDKTVTNVKLRETIVGFEEGIHHAVKDICIDEGVRSPDKILSDTDKVNHNGEHGIMHSEMDEHCGSGMSGGVEALASEDQPALDAIKDAILQCDPTSWEENREKLNPFLDDSIISDENIIVEKILPPWESDMIGVFSSMPGFDENNLQQPSDQVSIGEVDSTAIVGPSTEEMAKTDDSTNARSSKVEGGSNPFDMESGPHEANVRERSIDTTDQQSGEAPKVVGTEETVSDVPSVSSRSLYTHGHGDRVSGAPSGHITYSGQIPFSGSISLRSDSSTTSARSFAFPVMHSEWNSSPVKMAKADRRHVRKHRGWRDRLLCCRF
ncbi:hypothetical protein QJS10_CPA05g02047 [Acorus calamus]|uniref:Uncharacterized protein n=1 Tax=Acorus calamus TaxID=4465 RepID=A0AAV9EVF3_ACOCL|nr:hypothetical protein QJS10_CPA05g02047 [Acorus calamus]